MEAVTPSDQPQLVARLLGAAQAASIAVAVIGAVITLGWLLNIPALRELYLPLAPMKVNTAVIFVLLGVALWFSIRAETYEDGSAPVWPRWVAIGGGAIALATLVQYITGIDLGIDQLLRHDPAPVAAPGRMSPATALCLMALAIAILGVDSVWAERVTLVVALLAHIALLGYLYGVRDLYTIRHTNSVAMLTAGTGYLLAVGVVMARPQRGVMQLVSSDSSGGVLVRRLLPAVIVLPAVLALIRQWGEHAGYYGTGMGRALLVAANSVIFVSLSWWTATAIGRIDVQRRAAEAKVRESAARKAAMLESAMDAIISFDAKGTILEFNPAAEAMFGRPRAAALGTQLVSWLDAGASQSTWRNELANGFGREPSGLRRTGVITAVGGGTALGGIAPPVGELTQSMPPVSGKRLELTALHANGRAFPIEVAVSRIGREQPAMYTAFLRDVTDPKRASADLIASNSRLQVLAGLSDAFATVATNYQSLLDKVARVICDLIGDACHVTLISGDGDQLISAASAHRDPQLEAEYRRHVTGMTVPRYGTDSIYAKVINTEQPVCLDTTPEAAAAAVDDSVKAIVARLNVHSVLAVPIRARGTTIGTLSLLRGEPGHSYRDDDVTMLQDLADRAGLAIENARLYAQLEERVRERTLELEATNQDLESFSYSVAHDLRAPLRTISGFSHALLEDAGDRLEPEGRRHATRIRAAATHMGELIDGLLNLSRVGRQELHRERIDVSALAKTVLGRLRAAHPERDVEVILAPELVAHADPQLVEIVLTNLFSNAWKFTGKQPHGRIELTTKPGERPTVYVVRDNGAGFPPEMADKLFGVFQRLHVAQEFEGTGIGLATVQRIVHGHGGRIWAEGDVDRGAAFYFTLEGRRRSEILQVAVG